MIPGNCRHAAQYWGWGPNGDINCPECDRQEKAYPKNLPTCVMCGDSLGKSLQAWMLGCCSGACAERRNQTTKVTPVILLDEFYKRIKPYWAGSD